MEYVEGEDDDDEQVQEQMDMIVKDMVEQDIMNEIGDDEYVIKNLSEMQNVIIDELNQVIESRINDEIKGERN